MKQSKKKIFTVENLKNSACAARNQHLIKTDVPHETKKNGSKFGNIKTEVDGIVFDSRGEAKRYVFLKGKRKIGEIGHLELQKEYELNEGGTHSLKYVADFVYIDARSGDTVVEDFKGARTVVYKKKRKLMKKLFGIIIFETSAKNPTEMYGK